MPQEPTIQGRSLNQDAIDAIATRIDSYEQSWERRWEESDRRWDERMERLESITERIASGVEEIRGSIAQSAELQVQTQNKIYDLGDKLDRMAQWEHERDLKWDRRMDTLGDRINRITGNLEVSQQTAAELTKLVAVLVNRVAA